MVDDDPDTGDFFWTGVTGGEWEARPTQYHVVFFDTKEKGVSRAWVPDRRLERMRGKKEQKGVGSERLVEAVEMARQAGREELETRRRRYCLANRFKGPWGPVWPGWGEEEEDDRMEAGEEERRNVDLDLETEEEICRQILEHSPLNHPSRAAPLGGHIDIVGV